MDFATMPLTPDGANAVLIIIDRLTKLVMLQPCSDTITAKECAQIIFRYWFCTGKGFPRSIVVNVHEKDNFIIVILTS